MSRLSRWRGEHESNSWVLEFVVTVVHLSSLIEPFHGCGIDYVKEWWGVTRGEILTKEPWQIAVTLPTLPGLSLSKTGEVPLWVCLWRHIQKGWAETGRTILNLRVAILWTLSMDRLISKEEKVRSVPPFFWLPTDSWEPEFLCSCVTCLPWWSDSSETVTQNKSVHSQAVKTRCFCCIYEES